MARCFKWVWQSALLVGLLCAGSVYFIDQPLALFLHGLHGLHNSFLLQTSEYVTWVGAPKWWLALSLLAFLMVGVGYQMRRYTRQCLALLYFGATNMLALVLGSVLKFVLGRHRPVELFENNVYGFDFFSTTWAQHSMPSGHALAAFAAAAALSVLYRNYAWLFFTVAILVALSRLVLDMHYLSDIILGAYIGIISALIMRYVLYKDKIKTC